MDAADADTLLLILQDPNSSDSSLSETVRDIVMLGDMRAKAPLMQRLRQVNDPHWVRRDLVLALGGLMASEAKDLLLGLLNSEEEYSDVRRAAILSLGMIRAGDAVRPLISIVQSGKPSDLVYPSVIALGDIGDPSAVEALVFALQSHEPLVPQSAAQALARIGAAAASAIPRLLQLATTGNETERRFASEAITKIHGHAK